MAEIKPFDRYDYNAPVNGLGSDTLEHDPRLINEAAIFSRTQKDPVFAAQRVLHVGILALPAIVGIDKFANVLTYWPKYLSPLFSEAAGVSPQTFMHAVGVMELLIALGIALKPRIFGYVFAAWLAAISINLLIHGTYLDLVLHDVGLMAGAYALSKLSMARDVEFLEPPTIPRRQNEDQ